VNIERGSLKKDKSVIWDVLVILLYSAINIVVLIRHEPWEDEARAWLIARDLDLLSIFKQMAYEGTPALWHMLLVPLAKVFPDKSKVLLLLTTPLDSQE